MIEELSPLLDACRALKGGTAAIAERQRARFAEMLAFARANSPYYRELYRDLPERIADARSLPITDKMKLMSRFDHRATDPEVTLEKARAFVDNPELVGERFLGKHIVSTTSGATGPARNLPLRRQDHGRGQRRTRPMAQRPAHRRRCSEVCRPGGRVSMLMATGGHFASPTAAARSRKEGLRAERIQVLSVHLLMQELVTALDRFQPAVFMTLSAEGYRDPKIDAVGAARGAIAAAERRLLLEAAHKRPLEAS